MPEHTLKLRSFIAIDLSEPVSAELAEFQRELKKCGPDVRWTRPENIHLTLKFLGDIEKERADEIAEKLKGVCAGLSGFSLRISGTGVFPDRRSPRVLWAGVELNDEIIRLRKAVEDTAASLGFEREKRRFSPHLTLGRFRSSRCNKEVVEIIEASSEKMFGIIEVDSVLLMRSDLGPKGAKYTKIAEAILNSK